MNLGAKIIDESGEVWEVTDAIPTRDSWIFKNTNKNSRHMILTSESIHKLIETGKVRLWRNGLERARDIARSR